MGLTDNDNLISKMVTRSENKYYYCNGSDYFVNNCQEKGID